MIESKTVTGLVEQWLKDRAEYFLVDVNVSPDNRIVVEIDHPEGVWIDDCVDLSRHIESGLDRNVEDYELEVGSAGIGQPFKVLKQYVNHIGQNVEVLSADGIKHKGVLLSADGDGFVLRTKQKQTVEGRKRPVMVDVDMQFAYDDVKYTKYIISLK